MFRNILTLIAIAATVAIPAVAGTFSVTVDGQPGTGWLYERGDGHYDVEVTLDNGATLSWEDVAPTKAWRIEHHLVPAGTVPEPHLLLVKHPVKEGQIAKVFEAAEEYDVDAVLFTVIPRGLYQQGGGGDDGCTFAECSEGAEMSCSHSDGVSEIHWKSDGTCHYRCADGTGGTVACVDVKGHDLDANWAP